MKIELLPALCLAFSLGGALLYGAKFNALPTSVQRTAVKTFGIAGLAVMVWAMGGPPYLIVALAASALGDLLLAAPGQKRFLLGVVSFALAHGCYVPLFLQLGAGQGTIAPLMLVAIAGVACVSAFLLFRVLRTKLGPMKAPLTAYFAIILAMTGLALAVPPSLGAALIGVGAVAFAVSDMILGYEMFVLAPDAPSKKLTAPAVWTLYYGGQLLITVGVLMLSGLM
jgi:uncharacterized membrane protein YhhN